MTLYEYRKKKKISMRRFAKLIDVSLNSVWHYENGRVPNKTEMAKIKEVTKNWVKEVDFYV